MGVVVIGAGSQIGHFLVRRLLEQQQQIWAVSRRPRQSSHPALHWLHGGLPAMPSLQHTQARALVSFGPLEALAEWLASLETAPVARVVATSSMSIVSKTGSSDAGELGIVRRLHAGEAGLARECDRLGIGWTVLRPTLVYGAGLDKSLTPFARRARRWRLFPLPAASGLRQPVHADDIAQAALAALDEPLSEGKTLQIGGGERLAYREMFGRVRKSLGVATVPLPVPRFALALLARLRPAAVGPVSRLEHDLVADNSELERLLGVHPRPFRPQASMWEPVSD
jgi:nucleoside-diphosphate-sugar epimerase